MAKELAIYHVIDNFISERHWVVLATSKKTAREKVLDRVPDIDVAILADPKEHLDVIRAEDNDFTEIEAQITICW